MNVDGIDDIGYPEYTKRMPAHLKRPKKGKENIFMRCLPFVDEEFLERGLMGHGV